MRRSAAAALVIALAGCGGGGGDARTTSAGGVHLTWVSPPKLYTPPALPDDRILRGVVRNTGTTVVRVPVRAVELLDAGNRRVEGVATFAAGYLHGLYPPTREPTLTDRALIRIGRLAKVKPGGTTSLAVAWRVKPGARQPTHVRLGGVELAIPRR